MVLVTGASYNFVLSEVEEKNHKKKCYTVLTTELLIYNIYFENKVYLITFFCLNKLQC